MAPAVVIALVALTATTLTAGTSADAAPLAPTANASFVTRDGSELRLDGAEFRASGTNIYWLGLDENVGGVNYPTYFRIKDALDTAAQLGVNVVRSHMMTSTSQDSANPLALMPSLGEYNDEAFKTIDYAVAYAGSLGIRLILPLTDEWSYYHGGHRDFTAPLGLQPDDFYTDPAAISAYQAYIDHIFSHVNSLTGKRFVDDPTIMAWELGNEMEGMTLPWINQQVDFIRERAPEQLVAAGCRFDIDPDTLNAPNLDIVDVHYYPPTAEKVAADAATVSAANKVYIAGEYASTAATDELLKPAAADPNVAGMFFWSLFGNNDRGGFVPHDDGFTLHYPGDTDRMRTSVEAIQHYSAALGLPINRVTVSAPLITGVEQTNAINKISWRGTAGADSYRVQRSTDGAPWTDVTTEPVGASASPVTDLDSKPLTSYRVLAIAGNKGATTSNTVAASSGGNVLVDPLADWSLTAAHENAAIVPPSGAAAISAPGTASWNTTGITSAVFAVAGNGDTTVSTSNDGQTWTNTEVATSSADGLTSLTADDLSADYVRVTWAAGNTLELATISSAASPVALFDPLDDFSRSAAHTGSLSFDTGNPTLFGGDTSRLKRDAADGGESITWTYNNISGAVLLAYYWPDQPVVPMTLSGSADGQTFTALTPEVLGGTGNWAAYTYRLRDLTGVNYLKASWDGATGEVWTPQLSQLSLYSPNAPALGVPAAVDLLAPADRQGDVQSTPTFSWAPSASAAYYRFTLSTTPNLSNPVQSDTGISATSFQPALDLTPGTTYYWGVDAVNGLGTTSSSIRSFTTSAAPSDPLTIDDFESYADDAAINAAYVRNTGGGDISATLSPNPETASESAAFAYDLGAPGYAGVVRTFPTPESWYGYTGIGLSLEAPEGTTVSLQFVSAGGYWEAQIPVTKAGLQHVEIPFTDFAPPSWAGESRLDLSSVSQYAFYISGTATGTALIDDVVALAPTAVDPEPTPTPTATPTPTPTSAPTPTATAIPVPSGQPTPTASAPAPGAGDGNTSPSSPRGLASTGLSVLAPISALTALLLLGAGAFLVGRRRIRTSKTRP